MLVQQILTSKGGAAGVISVPPSALVAEAAQLLSEKRIGTVVVSSGQDMLDGILSERDIVRELGRRGVGVMGEPVSRLMTTAIKSCTPSDTADKVMQMMTDGRFRHMPVVDGGKLLGLVSIGDVVKARLSELAMEKDALEGMIMGH